MKERGIEQWEVEHVLEFPTYVKKSFGNRKEVIGNLKSKKIKVVFIELENYIKIITVI